jgi:hypothetical protein
MDNATKSSLQVRLVMAVYRGEVSRLQKSPRPQGRQLLAELTNRSLELLTRTRAKLDGGAASHTELLREIKAARAELVGNGR